jgi:hypothetical protein
MFTLAGGAVVAGPASATTTTPTTVTVTSKQSSIASGKAVVFSATVAPSKVGAVKITGSVTWTITTLNGTPAACTTTVPLTAGGVSKCMIAKGVVLAANGPYTATASYSGDATFDPSSGSAAVDLTAAPTHVKLTLSATPTSGAATTVTAFIVDGPATSAIAGTVVFTITSESHAAGVAVRCTGTATPASANDIKSVVAQTAVCNLPAGWMVVPKVTVTNPKPSNTWSVAAVYNGNANFSPSFATKQGIAKF